MWKDARAVCRSGGDSSEWAPGCQAWQPRSLRGLAHVRRGRQGGAGPSLVLDFAGSSLLVTAGGFPSAVGGEILLILVIAFSPLILWG